MFKGRLVTEASSPHPPRMRKLTVVLLAIASAVVTANAYYIHPIVNPVSETFAVGEGIVSFAPFLNQIAIAIGVLLILPLGESVNNRRLVTVCLGIQAIALLVMATVQSWILFILAATVVGLFTITPYLLPAYASKRVAPDHLGEVTAALTTGVIAGVFLSRTLSGLVAEALGWRNVYWIAFGLMILAMIIVPRLMDDDSTHPSDNPQSWPALMKSLGPTIAEHWDVLISGLIQGLSFAIFVSLWIGIGFYITSEEIGLGTDVVGLLSACTILNIMTTPFLGRWADHVGAERARLIMAFVQIVGILLLTLTNWYWFLLVIPIIITASAGPVIDVTGRMISLRQDDHIRTRMLTVYIFMMFSCGGLGSVAGGYAYQYGNWTGTICLALGLSLIVTTLCLHQYLTRQFQNKDKT